MLRYKTETRPGLVAFYDIRPGNGAGRFLSPRNPHGEYFSAGKVRKGCLRTSPPHPRLGPSGFVWTGRPLLPNAGPGWKSRRRQRPKQIVTRWPWQLRCERRRPPTRAACCGCVWSWTSCDSWRPAAAADACAPRRPRPCRNPPRRQQRRPTTAAGHHVPLYWTPPGH